MHGSLPHRLHYTSTDPEIAFLLSEIQSQDSVLQLCNASSSPSKLTFEALPTLTVLDVEYMRDLFAQHHEHPDRSDSYSHNGTSSKNTPA